ncbi:MAG: flagellar biosynthesis protein FlhF [Bdellovibrionales bacterium]|nr:flagellar biosynthesis protein FlhF [Bdellovibrionales bacterium]
MQVRKFEAKTMKEALELVKGHMGPEAIILSAKDNSRGFGLVGNRSVEVTAAISEETLKKKQMAEAKLPEKSKSIYAQSTAKSQKQFINKSHLNEPIHETPKSQRKYVDIEDDDELLGDADSLPLTPILASGVRVRTAAQRAWQAMNDSHILNDENVQKNSVESQVVEKLQAEILQLKKVLQTFQKVPQTFVSSSVQSHGDESLKQSMTYQKLFRAGINHENTFKLIKLAQTKLTSEQLGKSAFVDAFIAHHILNNTKIVGNRFAERHHFFVGPAGQGKTSSLVKLASEMVLKQKYRIAIVTTDVHKVGAIEQLRIYAKILNVPFAVLNEAEDWLDLSPSLAQVDFVLFDFPGLSLKNDLILQKICQIKALIHSSLAIHYVLSVLGNEESASELAQNSLRLEPSDLLFTGLDEAAQHGLIYNFLQRFNLPLHSFGIGRQIPEDFEAATKERVVDLIFKLTKLKRS